MTKFAEDHSEGIEENQLIGLKTQEHRHTILVEGDVDISTAPRLHAQLTEAFDGPSDEVIVDLREVSFIDSTGLGVLVNARQRSRTLGSTLKLVLPTGRARFPFEVTGLVSMFDMHDPESV